MRLRRKNKRNLKEPVIVVETKRRECIGTWYWRARDCGYTDEIRHAHQFERVEAQRIFDDELGPDEVSEFGLSIIPAPT